MVRVITITREYGAGASVISRMLADRLGWRVLDRELSKVVIRAAQGDSRAEADPSLDPWLRDLIGKAREHTGGSRTGLAERDLSLRTALMENAVRLGNCVIVGRGAQCILRGHEEVFHVFLYAPLPLRVERSRHLLGRVHDVEAIVDNHDRAQADFVRRQFGWDWRNPDLYNLMIDTRHGHRGPAEAIFTAAGFRTASAAD